MATALRPRYGHGLVVSACNTLDYCSGAQTAILGFGLSFGVREIPGSHSNKVI